jgi:hypothetical protein
MRIKDTTLQIMINQQQRHENNNNSKEIETTAHQITCLQKRVIATTVSQTTETA